MESQEQRQRRLEAQARYLEKANKVPEKIQKRRESQRRYRQKIKNDPEKKLKRKQASRRWYVKNQERIKETMRQRYWDDPDGSKERAKAWVREHRQQLNQKKMEEKQQLMEKYPEQYRQMMEKKKAYDKQWRAENPDKVKAYARKTRQKREEREGKSYDASPERDPMSDVVKKLESMTNPLSRRLSAMETSEKFMRLRNAHNNGIIATGFLDQDGRMICKGHVIGCWDVVDGVEVLSAIPVVWWKEKGAWAVDLSYEKDGSFLEYLSDNIYGMYILGFRENCDWMLFPHPAPERADYPDINLSHPLPWNQ